MPKGEIVWKIALLILGVFALVLYATEPERRLDSRYHAYLNCGISDKAVCLQLFAD